MSDQTVEDAVVDDDPEYANDAFADSDEEAFGFAVDDPATIPPDQGDAGRPYVDEDA